MKAIFSARPMLFIVLAGILICGALVGCFRLAKSESVQQATAATSGAGKVLQAIGAAPAAPAVSGPMTVYFYVAVAFIAIGAVAFAMRSWGTGLILVLSGIGINTVAVWFVQYPYLTLIPAIGIGILTVALARDRLRKSEVLESTAEAIQNVPEGQAIKAALAESALGEGVIRSVITPIKNKLRKEGRIVG